MMESSQSSVRRNIALKLKESAPSSSAVGTTGKVRVKESACVLVLCVRVYILVPTVPRSDSPDVLALSRKVVRTSAGFAQHEGKELSWDHTLNLIGRAIHRPLIHICEVCDKPILIYGRMVRDNVDNFTNLGILCSGGETVLYVKGRLYPISSLRLLRPF